MKNENKEREQRERANDASDVEVPDYLSIICICYII